MLHLYILHIFAGEGRGAGDISLQLNCKLFLHR